MSSHNNGKSKIIFEIQGDAEGTFIERINRFLAQVKIGNSIHYAHIHDPGRLSELLYKGNRIMLKRYPHKGRKTEWEVIAARYKDRWIFTNSKFHRALSERILRDENISPLGKIEELKAEVKIGNSRIDYLLIKNGKRIWVEVKGCTLEKDGVALFPDAPTERGRRHIEELHTLIKKGDYASLLILVFHKNVRCFSPNRQMDERFAEAYDEARKDGLLVYPVKLEYDGKHISFLGLIPLCED